MQNASELREALLSLFVENFLTAAWFYSFHLGGLVTVKLRVLCLDGTKQQGKFFFKNVGDRTLLTPFVRSRSRVLDIAGPNRNL